MSHSRNPERENKMETATMKFKVGQTIAVRSIGDYDCVFKFEVVKRTDKFVTFKYFNELKRVGIKVRDGREYCFPLGTYSMAPVAYALTNL
jgi:hypothetical protein